MSVLAPPAQRAPLLTTHHDGNTGTGSGTSATCEGYGSALLDITITATAELFVYGQASSGSTPRLLPITTMDGRAIRSIKESGFYRIDVTGMHTLTVSIQTNTGSVTARSKLLPISPSPGAVSLRRRNTVIAQVAGLELEAEETALGVDLFPTHPERIDLRDFAFVYFRVGADAAHSVGWTLDVLWTWHDNSPITFANFETVISTAERRAASPWLEVLGPGITVRLTNNDAVTRTYGVYMFGIR